MPGAFAGLALAGASLFVFPGLGDTIREPKWIWLWLFAFIALALLLFRRLKTPALPTAFWIFFFYLLAQPYFFTKPALAWPFSLCLVSLLLLSLSPPRSLAFDRLLLIATWLQLLLGALQLMGMDFIFAKDSPLEATHPLVGFLGQQTIFGAWMAPLAWYWFGKKQWVAFAFCSVAVFATTSAFSVFAWMIGLAAWLLWRYSWRATPCIAAASVAIYVWASSQTLGFFYDNGRYLAWRMLLSAWRERPWFGYGVDSFAREFKYHQGFGGPPWAQAHNEYLELLFGGGLVGLILGLSALSVVFFRRQKWWGVEESLPWFLALVVILANSLGNFPLHIAPIALLASMAYFRLTAGGSNFPRP